MGRQKVIDKGPRNIDLDILLFGDKKLDHERLKIPHIGIPEREFVLRPLAEYVNPYLFDNPSDLPLDSSLPIHSMLPSHGSSSKTISTNSLLPSRCHLLAPCPRALL